MNIDDAINLLNTEIKNLGLDKKGWSSGLMNALRICGECNFTRKKILLSKKFILLNKQEDIVDIIKHECAHALLPPSEGHGPKWKAMCVKLGCKPERLVSDIVSAPTRYTASCPTCDKRFYRHRRTRTMDNTYCSVCRPMNINTKLKWRENESA